MKKYYCVLLIVTGVVITGMRCPVDGRQSNRDKQETAMGVEGFLSKRLFV